MKISGAQAIINCLREQKTEVIFGYPGGAVLPLYDVIYDTEDIRHVMTSHEQNAVHAADGYARATGKVGVALVTSGPGATNTVTGIATAYMDSVPLVVLTGQVPLSLIGRDAFQEVDITGVTIPITKHNYIVKDASKLPEIIREAFNIARTGRPGPVLIDIPKDIQNCLIDYTKADIDTTYQADVKSSVRLEDRLTYDESVKTAVSLINQSSRPVIYAGGGIRISNATDELIEFAKSIDAPVVCSLMGIGGYPGDAEDYLGMVGMHGTVTSNKAVQNSDLLIALGARFSDRVISNKNDFAKNAKIIHVDIDPAEIGKNIRVDSSICGDVKTVIKDLTENTDSKKNNQWKAQIKSWKDEFKSTGKCVGDLDPSKIFGKLNELTEGTAIITTEVGQNQIWTAQYYNFKDSGKLLSSGGLGTMGYGLGASVGACIGRPDKKVINVAGDGSFKMNVNELSTLSRYRLPIVQLVLNNQALGMVRQWQNLFFNKRFSHTTIEKDVDYIKLAEAYNLEAYEINNNEEIDEVLEKAVKSQEPVVVICNLHPDEMVYPIVPPGKSISETIG